MVRWGIGRYGASVLGRFQHWGGRESQIVMENSTFSELIQNIYHVLMTTEKCRWRRKRTDLGRNFCHSYQNKAELGRKKSAKGTKSHLASEFRCNRYPPMSAEILRRFAAEHRVDFHWAGSLNTWTTNTFLVIHVQRVYFD